MASFFSDKQSLTTYLNDNLIIRDAPTNIKPVRFKILTTLRLTIGFATLGLDNAFTMSAKSNEGRMAKASTKHDRP